MLLLCIQTGNRLHQIVRNKHPAVYLSCDLARWDRMMQAVCWLFLLNAVPRLQSEDNDLNSPTNQMSILSAVCACVIVLVMSLSVRLSHFSIVIDLNSRNRTEGRVSVKLSTVTNPDQTGRQTGAAVHRCTCMCVCIWILRSVGVHGVLCLCWLYILNYSFYDAAEASASLL